MIATPPPAEPQSISASAISFVVEEERPARPRPGPTNLTGNWPRLSWDTSYSSAADSLLRDATIAEPAAAAQPDTPRITTARGTLSPNRAACPVSANPTSAGYEGSCDASHPPQDHDIVSICERLHRFFGDKEEYTKFLACRGESAQQLLDLLQDLLDYDPNPDTTNRRRIFKALIRLSRDSKLHPQCLKLPGVTETQVVAGGTFSDVYKGLLCGQNVAIKTMRVFVDSDIDALLKEFSREALIWRQLCHPNLLPFFCLFYLHGRLCLVSPWMENGHLRAFLKKGSCDMDRLLSLVLDVALGLAHLHKKGVVHGDLKGDNIFITPSFRACIADFGLSFVITSCSSLQFTNSSKHTQGGAIRYQAPELHRGWNKDLRSDIYAFACVVHEMLTGKAPFAELYTEGAVIQAVHEGRRPSRPASCPDGLWDLLQDCWDERPDLRPTASQVVERLEGPDIKAERAESTPDWDEKFTAKFRRNLRGSRASFPSWAQFERIIIGDDHDSVPRPVEGLAPRFGQVAGESSGQEQEVDSDGNHETKRPRTAEPTFSPVQRT
ncbi:kinase-like domain-containing protein [Roridomyces roridus]|uniref:Kinase-like domain-containing protein n=1 Tax=Roridomyces roridus TaxID=1738132 RepID=A0AAD7F779_9AGAR|nr:kinase-like domain-containing protein [Roridomyces roridus]